MPKRAPILGILGLVLLGFGLFALWATHAPRAPWWPPSAFASTHVIAGLVILALHFWRGTGSVGDFVKARSTRYGFNSLAYSALFIAAIVMINFMSVRYPLRTDVSVAKVNSLSDQSRQILDKLDGEVKLEAFVEAGSDPVLEELLGAYEYESSKVSSTLIDPQVQPQITSQAGITTLPTVRVWVGENSTLVTKPDEESITNGINRLAGSEAKHVYFVEGHGEPAIDDDKTTMGMGFFADALRKQNYAVDKLFLPDVTEPPADAAVIVVGPNEKDYFEHELDILKRYLEGGGHMLVLMEPRKGDDIAAFIANWGITAGNDVILDQQIRLFSGPTLGLEPVVTSYAKHPAVEKIADRTIFSMARSITPSAKRPEKTEIGALAMTSQTSWAETDLDTLFDDNEAEIEDTDLKGPVPIAGIARGPAKKNDEPFAVPSEDGEKTFELAVFGDSTFVTNKYWRRFYNDALALSVVGYLAGEDQLISIGARAVRASRAYLTSAQATTVFYLSVLLLPELILFWGIAVWWRRSHL